MSIQPMPAESWDSRIRPWEAWGTADAAMRTAMRARPAANTGRTSFRFAKYESRATRMQQAPPAMMPTSTKGSDEYGPDPWSSSRDPWSRPKPTTDRIISAMVLLEKTTCLLMRLPFTIARLRRSHYTPAAAPASCGLTM